MINCDKCGYGHKTSEEMDACKSWPEMQAEAKFQEWWKVWLATQTDDFNPIDSARAAWRDRERAILKARIEEVKRIPHHDCCALMRSVGKCDCYVSERMADLARLGDAPGSAK